MGVRRSRWPRCRPRSARSGSRRRPRSSGSPSSSSASPRRSPVASASGWPWVARSCATRRCSAWTSRCPTWTPRCAWQTRTDIARLQQDLGVTTVYVTHDQVEAMTMGDRVAVMKLGILQQVDTPLKLYDKPANLFVAGFIGSPQMNLLEGVAADGRQVSVGGYKVPVDPTAERKMQRRHHRRRASGELAAGLRRRGRAAGEGDGGRGARRRQLRLRHLRRGGRALQRHRPHRPAGTTRRRARCSTSRPTRTTSTSSTPTPGSGSPTDPSSGTRRGVTRDRRVAPRCCVPPAVRSSATAPSPDPSAATSVATSTMVAVPGPVD